MSTRQPNATDHRDIDAALIAAGTAGEATVSAERAFLSDVRLVLAVLDWARVREAGFAIAGPKARETHLFGSLIAVAAIGSLTLPGIRRAAHSARVTAQRVGQQRMRIYGAAQRELDESAEQRTRPGRRPGEESTDADDAAAMLPV